MDPQFWIKFLSLPEIQEALEWTEKPIIVEDHLDSITTEIFVRGGFLSKIYEVKDSKTHKSVLLKISIWPEEAEILQLPEEYVKIAFDREILFYRDLYPALMQTSSASCLPTLHFVGEIDKYQCVVLSNLKNAGFQSIDLNEGLSAPLLKLTISRVARLQLHLTELKARMPHLDLTYPRGQYEGVKMVAARCREAFLQDIANYPLFHEDVTFDIKKFERYILQDEKMHLSGEHPLERVVKHGDIWPANLFYRPRTPESNEYTECAVVDWQFVNDTSGPLHDLTNLLLFGCAENALEPEGTLQDLFDTFQEEWKNTPYEFTSDTFRHYLIDSFVFAFYWLVGSWGVSRAGGVKPRIMKSVYFIYKYFLKDVLASF